jgi:hypothetical protein
LHASGTREEIKKASSRHVDFKDNSSIIAAVIIDANNFT